jgi:Flp pilus assembly protein TadB
MSDPHSRPGSSDEPTDWQRSQSGSRTLRSFGTAWIVIGVLGLLALLVAYLLTDLVTVWVAVPLLLVFLMLGGMWHFQGRRRGPRD